MDRPFTFGIVGGYGATGRVVTAALCNSATGPVLIGGRDLAKGQAVASEFAACATATSVDVNDADELEEFCSRCSVIVNCAGPVCELQDRVAQAAFRARCHYVDPAGISLVKERLLPHSREIENMGLSFVISGGWMPGITEVVPAYANLLTREKMDSLDSISLYFADSGDWSVNALRDGAWFIHRAGLHSAGYFHHGEWTKAKMSQASVHADLGEPVGSGQFVLYGTPELSDVAREIKDCDILSYTYLSGLQTVISTTVMALLPLPKEWGVAMVRNIFRRNRRSGVAGFVVAQAQGKSQGRPSTLTVQVTFSDHRDYWMHGTVMSLVARAIASGKSVRRGLHFLAGAVELRAFVGELQKAGVDVREDFALA